MAMLTLPNAPTLRGAKYRRVSTLMQAQHGYSLAAQDKDCDRLAEELGVAVVANYEDNDSGADWNLPGLNAMLDAARRREFDVLLVYDPDRLARNMAKQLVVEEELRRYGVTIEYVGLRLGNSPEDRLLKNVRASISEYEREKIQMRTLRGKREKAERGQVVGGSSAPYGYRFVLNDKGRACGLDEHPVTAEVVRRIFAALLNQASAQIAAQLDSEGIPPPRSHKGWNASTIHHIATHAVYRGCWLYKGIEVTVPALIDPGTWKSVQESLTRRQNTRKAHRPVEEDPYILRGRLACGFCGGTLFTHLSGKWRYYMCWRSRPRGARLSHAAVCPMSDVHATDLEAHVWRLLTESLLNPENLRTGLAAARAKFDEALEQQQMRVAVLDQEIGKQRSRLQKIALQRLDVDTGGELDQVLLAAAQEAERAIRTLQQERARLAATPTPGLSSEQVLALQEFTAQVRTGITAATPADMRQIYDLIKLRGTIRKDPEGIRLGRKHCFTCQWDAQLPLRESSQRVLRSWLT